MTGFLRQFTSNVRVALALGVRNILEVSAYRLQLRSNIHPVQKISASFLQGPYFTDNVKLTPVNAEARSEWQTERLLFGWKLLTVDGQSPDFLANPLTGNRRPADQPWWEIPDFSPEIGDIKLIWDQSRFAWALAFAQRARNGDDAALEQLNQWIEKWCLQNPPYLGVNWKCGQETSLRIMHLAIAAIILKQEKHPEPALQSFITAHLRRIGPTIGYALAQDNNHGIAESAGLFVGGSWLFAAGDRSGEDAMMRGRELLENRVLRLINEQGGFSMYSLNYHRVLVDILSMCEIWRRHLNLPSFTTEFVEKSRKASEWLRHMIDDASGDGPNIGANDGSLLFPLTNTPFRDYRISVQLGYALFADKRVYRESGPWDDVLLWLDLPRPTVLSSAVSRFIDEKAGFVMLQSGSAKAALRLPAFQFRPSQADALHVDFWLNGENLLRDGGSYSYYAGDEWSVYFGGTESHNTIAFDGRDQMRRIGRFLFGDWLQARQPPSSLLASGEDAFSAGYEDAQGARHYRHICLHKTKLRIDDEISGFSRKAVLRWRLSPRDWQINGSSITDGSVTLSLSSDQAPVRFELVPGWESRHYLEKTELPVLEIEFSAATRISTEIHWTL